MFRIVVKFLGSYLKLLELIILVLFFNGGEKNRIYSNSNFFKYVFFYFVEVIL